MPFFAGRFCRYSKLTDIDGPAMTWMVHSIAYGGQFQNGSFCPFFQSENALFCQDWLGTNIGKALKKECTVFLQTSARTRKPLSTSSRATMGLVSRQQATACFVLDCCFFSDSNSD